MFLRLAVGRPLCIPEKEGLIIETKDQLPPGYDSVYIMQDSQSKSVQEDRFFRNDYILYNNNQVKTKSSKILFK